MTGYILFYCLLTMLSLNNHQNFSSSLTVKKGTELKVFYGSMKVSLTGTLGETGCEQ